MLQLPQVLHVRLQAAEALAPRVNRLGTHAVLLHVVKFLQKQASFASAQLMAGDVRVELHLSDALTHENRIHQSSVIPPPKRHTPLVGTGRHLLGSLDLFDYGWPEDCGQSTRWMSIQPPVARSVTRRNRSRSFAPELHSAPLVAVFAPITRVIGPGASRRSQFARSLFDRHPWLQSEEYARIDELGHVGIRCERD